MCVALVPQSLLFICVVRGIVAACVLLAFMQEGLRRGLDIDLGQIVVAMLLSVMVPVLGDGRDECGHGAIGRLPVVRAVVVTSR